jgi:hypothetical protein
MFNIFLWKRLNWCIIFSTSHRYMSCHDINKSFYPIFFFDIIWHTLSHQKNGLINRIGEVYVCTPIQISLKKKMNSCLKCSLWCKVYPIYTLSYSMLFHILHLLISISLLHLLTICLLLENGYVPLVVNTSRSFPHSWLITGL